MLRNDQVEILHVFKLLVQRRIRRFGSVRKIIELNDPYHPYETIENFLFIKEKVQPSPIKKKITFVTIIVQLKFFISIRSRAW